jgi:hypothetical protein
MRYDAKKTIGDVDSSPMVSLVRNFVPRPIRTMRQFRDSPLIPDESTGVDWRDCGNHYILLLSVTFSMNLILFHSKNRYLLDEMAGLVNQWALRPDQTRQHTTSDEDSWINRGSRIQDVPVIDDCNAVLRLWRCAWKIRPDWLKEECRSGYRWHCGKIRLFENVIYRLQDGTSEKSQNYQIYLAIGSRNKK